MNGFRHQEGEAATFVPLYVFSYNAVPYSVLVLGLSLVSSKGTTGSYKRTVPIPNRSDEDGATCLMTLPFTYVWGG